MLEQSNYNEIVQVRILFLSILFSICFSFLHAWVIFSNNAIACELIITDRGILEATRSIALSDVREFSFLQIQLIKMEKIELNVKCTEERRIWEDCLLNNSDIWSCLLNVTQLPI